MAVKGAPVLGRQINAWALLKSKRSINYQTPDSVHVRRIVHQTLLNGSTKLSVELGALSPGGIHVGFHRASLEWQHRINFIEGESARPDIFIGKVFINIYPFLPSNLCRLISSV